MATKSPSCKDPVSQQRYLDEIHKNDAETLCKVLLVNTRSCHTHILNITIKYLKLCILYILLLARSERYAIIAMMERLEEKLSFRQSHHHLSVKNGRAGYILPGLPYRG